VGDGEEQIEIESLIVPEVVKRHKLSIANAAVRGKSAEGVDKVLSR